MAETPKRSGPTALTTSTATIYTAPSGGSTWAILRSIHVANEASTAANVTAGVGTTNTDAAGKRIAKAITVNPGQSLDLLDGHFLTLAGGGTPDLLYALADVATSLTITVSLVEGP